MKSLYIHCCVILAVTVVGFWLRFANLDAINFYNDEYYQMETAVGVVETGEYRRYNFYTKTTGEEYGRAKLYTWQIAQSFKLFGYNETAARLPAVLWGTLLIPLIIIIVLRYIKNPWVAYSTAILITFDNFFIEMARFTRMYSMVFVCTVLVLALLYECVITSSPRRKIVCGIATIIVWFIELFIFYELALALAAGIGVYVSWRAMLHLWKQRSEDKMLAWLFIIGSGLSVAGVVVHFFIQHIIPVNAFIVRSVPHFFYLSELFSELHIPEFGFLFLILGLVSFKWPRSFESFLAVVGLSVLAYFIYFSHRWEAKRYIGFIIPLFYIIISLGIVRTAKLFMQFFPLHNKVAQYILAGLFFIVVGPWLAWPGVPTDYFMVQPAYADLGHSQLKKSNVQAAYDFVEQYYKPGETVFIQDPRYFYWPDNSIPVVELGRYKSLSFDDFKLLLEDAESGGWVLYNAHKTRHLEKKIRQYCANRFEYFYELYDTGVFVFHFTPKDLTKEL